MHRTRHPAGAGGAALVIGLGLLLLLGLLGMHGASVAMQPQSQAAGRDHSMAMSLLAMSNASPAGIDHRAETLAALRAPQRPGTPRPGHESHVTSSCKATLASGVNLFGPTSAIHGAVAPVTDSPAAARPGSPPRSNRPSDVDLNRLCISRT